MVNRYELNRKLFKAVRSGDIDRARQWLQEGAYIHSDNDYALRLAVYKGQTRMVQILLEAGANVHTRGDKSPLRVAARYGHSELVKVFLEAGANINDYCGSALSDAAENGHVKTVRLLLQAHSIYWFTQDADVHAEDDYALRQAALYGRAEIVQILLQAGANVHAKDDYALRYAAQKGHTETVQILLQAGANVHAEDDYAIRWAALYGRTVTVQVLLQAGANVHAWNDEALRQAAEYGRTATVQLLLQAGANVHAENGYALRLAAFYGHTETVQILLQAGTNVHAENGYALRWAAENGHTETVQVLLQAGADCSQISLSLLNKFLTPKFLLTLSDDILLRMENDQRELKEKYQYSDKKNILQIIKKENNFDVKINLADFYYRPGGAGYYNAISF